MKNTITLSRSQPFVTFRDSLGIGAVFTYRDADGKLDAARYVHMGVVLGTINLAYKICDDGNVAFAGSASAQEVVVVGQCAMVDVSQTCSWTKTAELTSYPSLIQFLPDAKNEYPRGCFAIALGKFTSNSGQLCTAMLLEPDRGMVDPIVLTDMEFNNKTVVPVHALGLEITTI